MSQTYTCEPHVFPAAASSSSVVVVKAAMFLLERVQSDSPSCRLEIIDYYQFNNKMKIFIALNYYLSWVNEAALPLLFLLTP